MCIAFLMFIHSETGKNLTRTDYNVIRTVVPNNPMWEMVNENPHKIISIHNHPNSSPPSVAGLMVAYQRKYKYGMVACHNGTVFVYQVDKPVDESMYKLFLDKYNAKEYNNAKEFIDDVSRLGVFMEVL